MIADRSHLGVNLGVDHDRHTNTIGTDGSRTGNVTQNWTFTVGPVLERYLHLGRDVSPYAFAGLEGSYGWEKNSAGAFFNAYTRSAALRFGLGADWTPLEAISVGASTGILWRESMRSLSATGAPKNGRSEFGTVTSALTLHLYF